MEIVKYPHPVLRRKAEDVKRIDKALLSRVRKMFQTMYENRGVGLAAPQVGWSVRLFIVNATGQKEDETVFVNPVIVETHGSVNEEEGCLSVPGINAKVKRAQRVRVKAFDLEGQEFEVEADGMLAIVLQHEQDHIDGILFVTKLSRAGKLAVAGKLKDMEKKFKASHPGIPAACLT
jgi:peptide deformylase